MSQKMDLLRPTSIVMLFTSFLRLSFFGMQRYVSSKMPVRCGKNEGKIKRRIDHLREEKKKIVSVLSHIFL
jgi:hypothetical protein